MDKFLKLVGYIVLGFLAVLGFALLMSYPLMWCWNYAVVPIFHLQQIGVLQAFCLHMVCGSLFKSSISASQK